jgi:ABC-type phosphate/phosphonate transport system substrate-binding protein
MTALRGISLPMYDFPEFASATTRLVARVVEEVSSLGEPVVVDTPENAMHHGLIEHWESDATYLSQSCGLPFVEQLHRYADVIGTIRWTGISDARGWYRTVIVVRADHPARTVEQLKGARPVISNTQSLSGWCSLGWALAQVTSDPGFVQPYRVGERHTGSLQLLQDNEADFASIDPATFSILSRHRAELVQNLRVIGHGPLVPATPLHVSKIRDASLEDVRAAVARAFADLSLADVRDVIGIDSFVGLDNVEYDVLHGLVAVAEQVLPRQR